VPSEASRRDTEVKLGRDGCRGHLKYISIGECHPWTTEQAMEKMEGTNVCRRNGEMVSDETIAVLIEKISLLSANIVTLSDELKRLNEGKGLKQANRELGEWASRELQSSQLVGGDPGAAESLKVTERRSILKALVRANGSTLKAARILGIGRTTLYRKLQEYKRAEASRGERAGTSPELDCPANNL
jgi:Bacterial regulatory protein, Fis family